MRTLQRIGLVLCLVLGACTSADTTGPGTPDDAIVIASFNFPESQLLMELYAQALEARGLAVRREPDLGTREFVEPALERGLVDLVPEYAGSALTFVTLDEHAATSDPIGTHDALETAFAARGVSVLAAAPAQDRNEVAVTAATARAFGLRTISDLQTHADEMIFGGPPECQDRPFCLPGLARVYGLHFSSFLALDAGGPLTLQALRTGAVDAAVVFSSDGATARAGLVLLRDDRGLQPAENVTPVVATSALVTAGPRLAATVNAVSAQLTDEDLRTMNAQVAVDEIPAAQVAATWLREHGLAE